MPAVQRRVAHLSNEHIEPRLDGVQKRRLADAALSGEHARLTAQELSQAPDAQSGCRARHDDFITELAVQTDDRLERRDVDEIRFVEAENRSDAALLRRDDVSIDEIQLQPRLGHRADDDELVHVRGDDLLAIAVLP